MNEAICTSIKGVTLCLVTSHPRVWTPTYMYTLHWHKYTFSSRFLWWPGLSAHFYEFWKLWLSEMIRNYWPWTRVTRKHSWGKSAFLLMKSVACRDQKMMHCGQYMINMQDVREEYKAENKLSCFRIPLIYIVWSCKLCALLSILWVLITMITNQLDLEYSVGSCVWDIQVKTRSQWDHICVLKLIGSQWGVLTSTRMDIRQVIYCLAKVLWTVPD